MASNNALEPIYLDYNATTPIDTEVQDEMIRCVKNIWGNPSSSHVVGRRAKEIVDQSREYVSSLLNADPSEIIFTSGGTESNNYAIKGVALHNYDPKSYCKYHIITSVIEHPAVTEVCEYLKNKFGFEITYVGVDKYGMVNPADIEKEIRKETILITIMHSNNEVGTIQPIKEIASIGSKYNILVHTDASQSVGKVKLDVKDLGVDMLTVAGHKLYAPKGVGAIYVKKGVENKLDKIMHGATNHERGRRSGTENLVEIIGLGTAAKIANRDMDKNIENMKGSRDKLLNELMDQIKLHNIPIQPAVNGHPTQRLPNTLSISFPGLNANEFIGNIKDKLCVSMGAACHSSVVSPSATLLNMGCSMDHILGTLRISTGKSTSIDNDILPAVSILVQSMLHHLSKISNQ